MTVDRLHAVLSAVGEPAPEGQPVTAREVAEILWLAAHIAEDIPVVPERPEPAETAPSAPPHTDMAVETPSSPAPPDAAAAPPPRADRHRLYGPPDPGTTAGDGAGATAVLVPTAPMLDHPLAIQRALRPLKRRVPSRRAEVLDEEATAARIAEQPAGTRPWVPVMTASAEPWMNLVLVVDLSPSMRMWRSLARELQETLTRLGAFRDLRVCYLTGAGVASSPRGSPRDAATLIDPSGRQVVLVLSDCSGPHWWDGRAAQAVRQWARSGPTAIVQPLSERLWRRTAAPAMPGGVVAARPGAPNSALRFIPYDGASGAPPDAVPVPVLECAPGWLADWARMVAGDGGTRPAAMTYLGGRPPDGPGPVRHERELPIRERVRRFQTTASPEAARLAAHVAVSFPGLPVMQLVQQRILRDPRPGHLAEVLLSGLLRPVDGDAGWYDFVAGAREALLTTLPRSEAWHTADVLNLISEEIERRAGLAAETFRAYLPSENLGEHAIGPHGRPFALVSAEAVRLLSRTALAPPTATEAQEAIGRTSAGEPDAPPEEPSAAAPSAGWPMGTVRLLDLPYYRDIWQSLASFDAQGSLMDLRDPRPEDPLWELWKLRERDPLQVAFGSDAQGRPVTLDFREAAQGGMGPHGLLAWSPGSGKAELIRTLILGLALTHSPDVVNFLLVGFGGGVTARGLDDLPHISEIVTDHDDMGQLGEALRWELSRRQELLRPEFRSHREYEEARARGAPLGPLPTLIVVVDEVFELQRLWPELADALNEIGWKGRALGVHLLIVAAPVDRSLPLRAESYVSYRICLRIDSPDASEAVLGNTDGYYLPRLPGHGFLKVGTETYQPFRAAYTGDDADAIVRRLAAGTPGGGPVARRILPQPPRESLALDLEALNRPVTLDRLLPGLSVTPALGLIADQPAVLSPVVGVVRRPGHHFHYHEPLHLDLFGARKNVAVAGAQRSGKSRFLGTLVASLALTHTPQEVRFYCLDFGGGLLSRLGGLPHVGDVATPLDTDAARRIVLGVARLLEEREARSGGPEIFLVVDRWRTVRAEFPDLVPVIADLALRGPRRGIQVLLSTRAWVDLPTDSFGVLVEMRLEDPRNSLVDPDQAAHLPHLSGRGLLMGGEHFLAALPRIDGQSTFTGLERGISHLVASVRDAWHGPLAPSLVEQDRPAETPLPEAPVEEPSAAPRARVGLWGPPGSGRTSFLAALHVAALQTEDRWRITGVDRESADLLMLSTDTMTRRHAFLRRTGGIQNLSLAVLGETERVVGRRFRRRTEKIPLHLQLDLIDALGSLYVETEDDNWIAEYAFDETGTEQVEALANCDGLVYLYDPLRKHGQAENFQSILQNIAFICRQNGRFDTHLPHHLAVCITKFDDPQVLDTADRLGCLTADQNLFPRVDADRAEDFFLFHPGTQTIHGHIQRYFHPDRVRYFVTSSVGFYSPPGATQFRPDDFQNVVPDRETGARIRGDIHPINVLEPLQWLADRITEP